MNEIIKELRRPFPPELVKYRVGTADKGSPAKWAVCLAYVDARDVIERLNLVVGFDWSSEHREIFEDGKLVGVEASITISQYEGIEEKKQTRTDVGSLGNVQGGGSGDHGFKALWSDAFKRAAVKWGIGIALYFHPMSFAKDDDLVLYTGGKNQGKIKKIAPKAEERFRKEYEATIAGGEWGEVL